MARDGFEGEGGASHVGRFRRASVPALASAKLPAQPQAKAGRHDAEARPRLHVNRPGDVVAVEAVVMAGVMALDMVAVMTVAVVSMSVTVPMAHMAPVTMPMTMAVAMTVRGSLGLRRGEGQSDDGDGSQQETLHGVTPRLNLWVGGPGVVSPGTHANQSTDRAK